MARPCVRALLLGGAAAILFGQARDLTSLSLEDFLQVEVTSVSKVRQKLARTPAAVYVITHDDILRSGASNLPEALRLAPGVHVARMGSGFWSVGIRGFNGVYSNKLLVLIDGRTIYSPLFSGVFWGENLVLLDDVERIEIVRGPGATMWGANAVSGVISVTTKDAWQTEGGLLSISGGDFNPARAAFRYGSAPSDERAWRTWGQYSRLEAPPPFPGERSTGAINAGRAGALLEWAPSASDTLLLEGEFRRTVTGASSVDLADPFGPHLRLDNRLTGAFVRGAWRHTAASGDEVTLRMYADMDSLEGSIFNANTVSLDADLLAALRPMGRHRLLAGGGVRVNLIRTTGTPSFDFSPADRNYAIVNAFLQDEWELQPQRLALTVGARIEGYRYSGHAFEPTLRLMWTPTATQGYWIAASRAVRTPAHADFAERLLAAVPGIPMPVQLHGSLDIRPERLIGYEAGYRNQVQRRVALDITAFHHRYGRLAGYVFPEGVSLWAPPPPPSLPSLPSRAGPVPVLPLAARNVSDGVNQGVEANIQADLRPGLQVTGSYSALFARTRWRAGYDASGALAIPIHTPEHQGQARIAWSFARGWSTDLMLYRFGATPDSPLRGFTRLDCRIARKLTESVELSVAGAHLLRPYQAELVGDVVYPGAVVPRSVEATLRWTF